MSIVLLEILVMPRSQDIFQGIKENRRCVDLLPDSVKSGVGRFGEKRGGDRRIR